ncbi:hypothetical protein ABK040_011520 [Willaertia magna]
MSAIPNRLKNYDNGIEYLKIEGTDILLGGNNKGVAIYKLKNDRSESKECNNKRVVIKRICTFDYESSETDDHFKEKFKKLHSQHIIKCIDLFQDEKDSNYYYFVMEDCGDNLNGFICKEGPQVITLYFIVNLITQMIIALSYLQQNNLYHGDIKPDNIFMKDKYTMVLGDLGTVGQKPVSSKIPLYLQKCQCYSSFTFTQGLGTPGYQAPEINDEGGKISLKIDIWSFGVTLLELLCKKFNTQFKVKEGLDYKDELNHLSKTLTNNEEGWNTILELIGSMLEEKPENRISCEQIYKTIYCQDFDFSPLKKRFHMIKDQFINVNSFFREAFEAGCDVGNRFPEFLDKETAILILAQDGNKFIFMKPYLTEDKDVILAALNSENVDPLILFLSFKFPEWVYTDEEIIHAAGELKYMQPLYGEATLRTIFGNMKFADNNIYKLAIYYSRRSNNLIRKVEGESSVNEKESYQLRNDEYYWLHQHGIDNIFPFVSEELRTDKEFICKAVRLKPRRLQYVPENLKSDPKIVVAAIIKDPFCFTFLPVSVQENRQAVKELIQVNPKVIHYISEQLKKDKDLILRVLQFRGSSIENEELLKLKEYGGDELWNNEKFVKEALLKNQFSIIIMPDKYRDDKENMTILLKKEPAVFRYLSERLRGDKDFLLKKSPCIYLQYVQNELRDDLDIVLKSLRTDITGDCNLKYASERLQCDPVVIVETVKQSIRKFGYWKEACKCFPDEFQTDSKLQAIFADIRDGYADIEVLKDYLLSKKSKRSDDYYFVDYFVEEPKRLRKEWTEQDFMELE